MAQNSTQPSFYDDDINLQEVLKILLEFKKLIISTILIFMIPTIIYSLSLKPEFKSSSIIEIGYYEMPDGTLKLIEDPLETISSIRTNLIYKKRDNFLLENLILKSPENKLIELQLTSKSSKKNLDLLSQITNYIEVRHSKLALSNIEQKKDKISHDINLIETAISPLKERISINKESTKLELETIISKLQNDLPIFDQEINQLKQVIIEDTNNLNSLKGSSLSIKRATSSPTLEEVIFNYKSRINLLRREKNKINADLNILSQKLDTINKGGWYEIDKSRLEENVKASEIFTLQFDELFSMEQEQKMLENKLQTLLTQTLVNTNSIGDIQTETIKPKNLLTILLGLVIGFISGIFLVFINIFYQSYTKSKA